jgi:hypothetical protein
VTVQLTRWVYRCGGCRYTYDLPGIDLSFPVVVRIFTEYLGGTGIYAIGEGLTRDGIPSPSAHDPARNRHRSGIAWSKSAVKVILGNPRYTGQQVWNRQRKEEVLLDIDDVALGHQTIMRWNKQSDWIRSVELSHPAIIDLDVFQAVQDTMAGRSPSKPRMARATPRTYQLRGLLYCGLCQRKMQGNWNHGTAYYRCRFPNEYGLANHVEHPRTVYLKELEVVPSVDRSAPHWRPAPTPPSSGSGSGKSKPSGRPSRPAPSCGLAGRRG